MGLAADLGINPGPPSCPVFGRLLLRLACTRFGARLYSRLLHHLDRAAFTLSRDRLSFTETASGLPTVMLTTIGARSRRLRRVPLLVFPVDGDLAVLGSNFGRAAHPGWTYNLVAHPHAIVTRGGRSVAVRAQEVTGPQAQVIWFEARRMHPGYDLYAELSHARNVHVFVLVPELCCEGNGQAQHCGTGCGGSVGGR